MNPLDLTPTLWPALTRATVHGSIALIAVFAICRVFPSIPARFKCWLWRLAWLRVLLAFITGASIHLALLPAATPEPIAVPIQLENQTPAPIEVIPQTSEAVPVGPSLNTIDYLVLLWSLGVLLMLARLALHYYSALRLRRSAVAKPSNLLLDLSSQFKVRPPSLLISTSITKPLLTGIFKPAVILPISMLSADERSLELVFKHELAHLKRRDLAWNWLGAIAHTLFWFNPLTWLCEREANFTQEIACDELALRDATSRASEFAALLIDIAANREHTPQLMTVSIIRTKNTLERRLKAMKTLNRKGPPPFAAILLAALALAPAIVPWRVVAQKPDPAPTAEPAAAGVEAAPNAKPSVEEHFLLEEIKLAQKQLDATMQAQKNGRATTQEMVQRRRELLQLQRELATLQKDPAKVRETLQEEIKGAEQLQKEATKMQEVGVIAPDEKFKIDREVLRLKRQLAALDRDQPKGQPGMMGAGTNMSMMYYMSNPELMKRYFPHMYAMMTNSGVTNFQGVAQRRLEEPDASKVLERIRAERSSIVLRPKRASVVVSVHARKGEHVKRGQELVRLDDREASLRLRAAESEFEIAEADNALRRMEIERGLNLPHAGELKLNSNQRKELDALKLRRLVSELDLARTKLDQARLDLEDMTIRAPAAGVVATIPSVGQSISPESLAVMFVLDPPEEAK